MILDVVYNHLGPDGNYLRAVLAATTSPTATTTSGATRSTSTATTPAPVREFFIANAGYWIDEFHLDGLRLDATQQIFDASHDAHPARRSARRAREAAGGAHDRSSSPRTSRRTRGWCGRSSDGGYGLDALWNDDFHHSAMVALTGRAEAYYTDYRGTPQEFISAAKYGFLFQGQCYAWQKQAARHAGARICAPAAFVDFLENHDQVANSARGRAAARADAARAAAAR